MNWTKFIVTALIFFMLGFSLVLPIYNKPAHATTIYSTDYIHIAGSLNDVADQRTYQLYQSDLNTHATSATLSTLRSYSICENSTYVFGGTTRVSQYWRVNMTLKQASSDSSNSIYGLSLDPPYIYVLYSNGVLEKWWVSNLTSTGITVDYGTIGEDMCQDTNFLYVSGYQGASTKANKYWKTNLTLAAQSATYAADDINAITCDTNYVYIGGRDTAPGSACVWQLYKSDLSTKATSSTAGSCIRRLINDANYVYAAGDFQTVRQYKKSDMSLNHESSSYGNSIYALAQNYAHVFAGGINSVKVFDYWKTNLSKNQESSAYGSGGSYWIWAMSTYTYESPYVPEWEEITNGTFEFSNSSAWRTPTSGWFNFTTAIPTFQTVRSGYVTLSNLASYTSITQGYFTFENTSTDQSVTSGWFTFASERLWGNVSTGYFSFANTASFTSVTSGYFSFSNTVLWQSITSGYFTLGNTASWQSLNIPWTEELFETFTPSFTEYDYSSLGNTQWGVQTYRNTTNAAHTLTFVSIPIKRVGSPGTITLSLRAVSGGAPTGGDLCSGSINGNLLLTSFTWANFTMSPAYTIVPGTNYALVIRAPSAVKWTDYIMVALQDPGTYSRGQFGSSSNSGSTWSMYTFDMPFKEYGRKTTTLSTIWFTFANTGAFQSVTSGYFRFGNASSFQSVTSGYFTFHATIEWTNITTGWFSFANASSLQNIVEGYFTFASGVSWYSVNSGYFTFQNASTWSSITSGYFTFLNSSSIKNVTQGWFNFSNIPMWQSVRSGYFSFANVSYWTTLTSGWFSFQNESNATPIVRILLPHEGAVQTFRTPFIVTYSIYSSKKENVNTSLQVIYKGASLFINHTNVAMNSNQYWLNTTEDITMLMSTLGVTADYNSPYVINLSATNYVTGLYGEDQSSFRLRDSTYDLIILIFPLVILILFSILAFWKQSRIVLTATITTAILYAVMLATQFSGTIDSMYVVLLIVYALALSMMYFFWKKSKTK